MSACHQNVPQAAPELGKRRQSIWLATCFTNRGRYNLDKPWAWKSAADCEPLRPYSNLARVLHQMRQPWSSCLLKGRAIFIHPSLPKSAVAQGSERCYSNDSPTHLRDITHRAAFQPKWLFRHLYCSPILTQRYLPPQSYTPISSAPSLNSFNWRESESKLTNSA